MLVLVRYEQDVADQVEGADFGVSQLLGGMCGLSDVVLAPSRLEVRAPGSQLPHQLDRPLVAWVARQCVLELLDGEP